MSQTTFGEKMWYGNPWWWDLYSVFRSLTSWFGSIRSRTVYSYLHRASADTASVIKPDRQHAASTHASIRGHVWSLTSLISGLGFMRLGLVCFDLLIGLEAYSHRVAHEKVAPLTDKQLRPVLAAADVVMLSRKPHGQLGCPWTNIL
jgi:hypothetical protein